MENSTTSQTPLIRQYQEIKSKYQDALLFFRLGDFYELFFDDAKTASRILGITLTSRNKNDPNPVAMCGVPFHSATQYINKLVSSGYKVAICEQMEDPQTAKGIVKREVTRVITPGTQLDLDALNAKNTNFTYALFIYEKYKTTFYYWSAIDFSTGQCFFGVEKNIESWLNVFYTLGGSEILLPETETGTKTQYQLKALLPKTLIATLPQFYFDLEYALNRLEEQFNTKQSEAIHPLLKLDSNFIPAIAALIKYFQETQKTKKVYSLTKIESWKEKQNIQLSSNTIATLELLPRTDTPKDISLLSWLDHTKTALGGRLLKQWLLSPLKNKEEIEARLDLVEGALQSALYSQIDLSEIYDCERLYSKISAGLGNPRDLKALSITIQKAVELTKILGTNSQKFLKLKPLFELCSSCISQELVQWSNHVLNAIVDTPPTSVKEGGIFKTGFYPELDELINLCTHGESWLAEYESKERLKTGIQSLKVRYNNIYGYYIEVTKANLSLVPAHYIRKQSMSNGERFITEELKKFEEKILSASQKRAQLEHSIFLNLCKELENLNKDILKLSHAIAVVDVIQSLAIVAKEEECVRPILLDPAQEIIITKGRHPVVARELGAQFVANDVSLTNEKPFMLITGPNMGGKSTVMRQTAIIVLLAQMGAFVPAQSARISICDNIFTRIGANDNIAQGASTFMVEMSEMSSIIRNATSASLILLDEIGRGTSTYDGLSLAWALASDIITRIKAKTMFATHYHELTKLSQNYNQVLNTKMSVTVTEDKNNKLQIKFLYKLEKGAADRSYGILVARLAGLPENILKQAEIILNELESQSSNLELQPNLNFEEQAMLPLEENKTQHFETEFFNFVPLVEKIKSININELTPVEALNQLYQIQKELKNDESTTSLI
jgi:DNA mismatch repair protein MutS